ncbi:MAG: hypothetical protein K6F26_03490 [Lachnospiraceae bacterium]|nr:hypothetical protein [Lachnospiraceae bacterium]
MICVDVDLITPCLKDAVTGEMVDTEVIRIRRKSFLRKFNKRTGWYASWEELAEEHEIYALVVHGTVDIQGLIAIRNDLEMKALVAQWMVSAPWNNPMMDGEDQKRYYGVGGHLFAIAAAKSREYGYDGEFTGVAASRKLQEYYEKTFGAISYRLMHPYQIIITAESARQIEKVYTYEWTEEEI